MRQLQLCAVLGAIFAACCGAIYGGTYSGGSGTAEDPYLISTVDNLVEMGNASEDWDDHFKLVSDIDMSGLTFNQALIAPGIWNGNAFNGTFDGGGHRIQNLRIVITNPHIIYTGLFGQVGLSGKLSNLGIENVSVISQSSRARYFGGLCGLNGGNIVGCYTSGTVEDYSYGTNFGGLCGKNNGNIENSYSECTVYSEFNNARSYGGLCGANRESGTIRNCYSTGIVDGGTGGAFGGSHYVGGLCGINYGVVTNSYWDVQSSGFEISSGGTAKTSEELMTAETFVGWNDTSWAIRDNEDYPRLAWEDKGGDLIATDYPVRTYSGNGVDMPFEISNANDLVCMSSRRIDWDKVFILTEDLDMSGIEFTPVVDFSGRFDGQGHAISNLNVIFRTFGNRSQLGLFGRISEAGVVTDLRVEEVMVVGTLWSRCLGGLCGSNYGTIRNCSSEGVITGWDESLSIGGLCGKNSGTITKCFSTGTLRSYELTWFDESSYIGGLCGENDSGGEIMNCYSLASITTGMKSRDIGGLCGENRQGRIRKCFAIGSVLGGSGSTRLGGLCGENLGIVENCFWDRETSSQVSSEGGYSKNTVQMMTSSTFIGWDNGFWVIDEGQDYPHLVWEGTDGVLILTDYPERTYRGNGLDIPFEIRSSEDLVCMGVRRVDWDKSFVLKQDIDMDGEIYYPPEEFSGLFNGHGYCINNLGIDSNLIGNRMHLGLFGKIVSGGSVVNVCLENFSVVGVDYCSYVGGLCGETTGGYIRRCSVNGSVYGAHESHYIGGLSGRSNESTIEECFSLGSVESGDTSLQVGGLCGRSYDSIITNCYSKSMVTGGMDVGGFVGNNYRGMITNCFSIGFVTGDSNVKGFGNTDSNYVTNCFWDIETSGQGIAGTMGRTTAEMVMRSTFTSAGWDFVGETVNGTSDVWRMCADGVDYPRLAREFVQRGDFDCPDGVEMHDFAILGWAWLSQREDGNWDDRCNLVVINGDVIDTYDLVVFAENWLKDVYAWKDIGQMGYWQFDETTGNIAADNSVFERVGMLVNMDDSDWVEGKAGNALEFDGVDDFVEITGFAGLLGGQSRTVCAWIKTDTPGRVIIAWGSSGVPGGIWEFATTAAGQLRVGVGGGFIEGTADVCDGAWHHVAVVAENDGSPNINEVRFYVDGLPDEPGLNASNRVIDTQAGPDVTIGQSHGALFFEGTIDEVRIYDRPLSNEEIAALAP